MLADYKEQWSKQLAQHADSVQTIVAKSVSEALSKRKSEQDSFTQKQIDAVKASESEKISEIMKTM